MTYFTPYRYNFCWPMRTLRTQSEDGHWHQRTPAMAAGLADHVWSLEEWLGFPASGKAQDTTNQVLPEVIMYLSDTTDLILLLAYSALMPFFAFIILTSIACSVRGKVLV